MAMADPRDTTDTVNVVLAEPIKPKKKYHIISLDIESSGRDYTRHALLSIGLVDQKGENFYIALQHRSLEVEPQAMRVNQLPVVRIDLDGVSPKKADQAMLDWLNARMKPDEQAVAMGLNIGSFDMPFVRRWLPRSAARFSRRTMDLNALIFERCLVSGEEFDDLKHKLAKNGHARAWTETNGPQDQALGPHHALFDAYSNWGMFLELRRRNTQ